MSADSGLSHVRLCFDWPPHYFHGAGFAEVKYLFRDASWDENPRAADLERSASSDSSDERHRGLHPRAQTPLTPAACKSSLIQTPPQYTHPVSIAVLLKHYSIIRSHTSQIAN